MGENCRKKLYECRPRGLKNMVVGQLLPVTRNCLKVTTALKMIDPQTGLGPLTAETIAGTQDLYAPRYFQLKNEVIRQMRSEKIKFATTS